MRASDFLKKATDKNKFGLTFNEESGFLHG